MAIEEVGIKLDLQGRADTAKGLDDTDKQIDKLGDSGTTAGAKLRAGLGVLDTVGKKIATGVLAGGAAVTGIGIVAAKSLIGVGVQYNELEQTSRAAMTTLLGSKTAANQMANEVRAFGKTSPFPRQAFISATQQLLGYGFAAKNIIPTLKTINDTTAALGGNADTIGTITDVFAQIKSQGKLTGDTVQRLGGIGVNVLGILEKASGKNADAVQKAISSGSIKADDAIAVLMNGMNAKFGGAAAKVQGTWAGATDSVRAAWRDLGADLVAPFVSPTGGGYAITWANKLSTKIRSIDDQLPGVMAKLSTGAAAYRNGGTGAGLSFFERVGFDAERAYRWVAGVDWAGLEHRVERAFTSGSVGGFLGTLLGSGPQAHQQLSNLGHDFVLLQPAVKAFARDLPSVSSVLTIAAGVLGFAAKHVDTLVKIMPLLVGGYLLYRSALTVSTVANKVLREEQALQQLTAWRQIAATRANAAATRMMAREMMIARGATEEEVLAADAQAAAAGRGVIANGAYKIAALASAAASKIAAGAQWLLNAAMDANPVMIAVIAIGALVAIAILAYRHVGWFRDAVNATGHALVDGAEWVWKYIAPFTPLGAAIKGGIKLVKEIKDHWSDFTDVLKTGAKWLGKISDAMGIPGLGTILSKISGDGEGATSTGGTGSGKKPKHRAGGGNVEAGQAYIVGEHSAELFVPRASGVIVPRVPTQAGSSTGGAATAAAAANSGNLTVNLILDGQVISQVVLDNFRSMAART